MATHSSILAWRIPWTEEPGGLQSIVLQSQTQLKQLSIHASFQDTTNSTDLRKNRLISEFPKLIQRWEVKAKGVRNRAVNQKVHPLGMKYYLIESQTL